jgi:hypothetical protein
MGLSAFLKRTNSENRDLFYPAAPGAILCPLGEGAISSGITPTPVGAMMVPCPTPYDRKNHPCRNASGFELGRESPTHDDFRTTCAGPDQTAWMTRTRGKVEANLREIRGKSSDGGWERPFDDPTLVPTFRSSRSVSATLFCELRKVGTSKSMIPVPLIDLKSLRRTRRPPCGDFRSAILVEGHADPLLLAPDDVTGNVRAVRLKDEVETLGDVEGG